MSDITMCANKLCVHKKYCERQTAHISPFGQSWSDFQFDDKNRCEYFCTKDEKNLKLYKKNIKGVNHVK